MTATANGYHLDPSALANVPGELSSRPNWILWKYGAREEGGKATKLPMRLYGGFASSTDPATWDTFARAVEAFKRAPGRFTGVGFCFKAEDGLVGVDIDHSVDPATGDLYPWADAIFVQVGGENTYGELSPNGGIKLFMFGRLPGDGTGKNRKGYGPDKIGGVETYQQGRYFTVTGRKFHRCSDTIGHADEGLDELYEALCESPPETDDDSVPSDVPPAKATAKPKPRDAGRDDRVAWCMAYLSKCPPSISGSNGHKSAFQAACETIRFDLSDAEAGSVMEWWSQSMSGGEPWTPKEVGHKLRSANAKVPAADRGLRLRQREERAERWRREHGHAKPAKPSPDPDGPPDFGPPTEDDPAPPPDLPISAAELLERHTALRPPLIHGLLRSGEVMNMIAAPKMRKSWLVMALGLSVATGRPWLDKFNVEPGRVLLIDNELHPETLSYRLRTVAEGMGLTPADFGRTLDVFSLRGKLRDLHALRGFFDGIVPGTYSLIVIDAFYRVMPSVPGGGGENDNAAMTQVYNTIDRHALRIGAGMVLIHHSSKGTQGQKSVTDVGAGAGAQSRAADVHAVIREHEEDGAAVFDAVVRSFAPLAPIGLRWAFPTWQIDEYLDCSLIKKERGPGGRPRKTTGDTSVVDPEIEWTPETFVPNFVRPEPSEAARIIARATARKLTGMAKLTAGAAKRLMLLAEDAGLIYLHNYPGERNKMYASQPQGMFDTAVGQKADAAPVDSPTVADLGPPNPRKKTKRANRKKTK